MKRLLALVLCLPLLGCIEAPFEPLDTYPIHRLSDEKPIVNIPPGLRQRNWLGSQREGSCVHATVIMLMRWQGRNQLAEFWRKNMGNGEWPENLAAKFERHGVRFAYTSRQNDVKFLEWACRTRRGAGVTVQGGRHMVLLVHLDDKWAGILDNNNPGIIQWIPRERFLAEWKASYSWGVTIIYTPPPPMPKR